MNRQEVYDTLIETLKAAGYEVGPVTSNGKYINCDVNGVDFRPILSEDWDGNVSRISFYGNKEDCRVYRFRKKTGFDWAKIAADYREIVEEIKAGKAALQACKDALNSLTVGGVQTIQEKFGIQGFTLTATCGGLQIGGFVDATKADAFIHALLGEGNF